MKTFDQWMNEYSESHQHPTNLIIHKICIPLIMFCVIGFCWLLPIPSFLKDIPYFNWGIVFIFICMIFYFKLNLKMAIGMLVQTIMMAYCCHQLEKMQVLLTLCGVVFVLSWIGQFYGHKIEGKKPSFFQDMTFLLIGPLWVTKFLYQKLGIKI